MKHVSDQLIGRYTAGDKAIPGDQLWALEVHLESCALCRGRLGGPADLLDAVWAGLEPELLRIPPVRPRNRLAALLATWATPAIVAWACMILLVTVLAAGLDLLMPHTSDTVPLVLLLAPVLPVAGVFASWSRGLDPASELVAATPRAGLQLVLRRTVAVLAVVIPVLAVAGWATGTSIAPVLLPSLAFTTGTLALGSVIGIDRAAAAIGAVWGALIIAPWIAWDHFPYALAPASEPVWALAFAAGAVVVVLRRAAFAQLRFSRT
jgi:hypothetical protein